jgi:hypothetical protein
MYMEVQVPREAGGRKRPGAIKSYARISLSRTEHSPVTVPPCYQPLKNEPSAKSQSK